MQVQLSHWENNKQTVYSANTTMTVGILSWWYDSQVAMV